MTKPRRFAPAGLFCLPRSSLKFSTVSACQYSPPLFVSECPYDPLNPSWKPRKYGHKCGAYCPDVMSPRPPDLPPSLSGLTLIEGGKADMLPAEPGEPERRRRVGEGDDV